VDGPTSTASQCASVVVVQPHTRGAVHDGS
jgi:hypothetical protein